MNSRNNDMVEVNGRGIEDADRFVYLGATVSKEGGSTEDIDNRVVKARGVFLRLKISGVATASVDELKSGFIRH